MRTRIGTSSTGPPVPVRADPKPTIAPICKRTRVPKECAARSAEGAFAKTLTPVAAISVARNTVSTSVGSAALLRAPSTAAGTIPAPSQNTILQSTLLRLAYSTVPTTPVKRKLQMLVAIARWRSRPPTYVRIGGSSTPPMPTQPIRTPTIRAETNSVRTVSVNS
jgi:hypothetical protein